MLDIVGWEGYNNMSAIEVNVKRIGGGMQAAIGGGQAGGPASKEEQEEEGY